jgi:hypothetical protein
LVAVELEQVAGGGDQPPLRSRGGSTATQEAIDAAVELCFGEDRLDHHLALAVELAGALALQHAAREGVASAVPPGRAPRRVAPSGGIKTWTPRPVSSSVCSLGL